MEERNHELKHLDSKIIENETTLQNLEAQISRHKYKKKNQNFNEERQEQIEIFNSYMKSNISDGEGSLHSQNYSINKKDACLKNNDVCLCSIF